MSRRTRSCASCAEGRKSCQAGKSCPGRLDHSATGWIPYRAQPGNTKLAGLVATVFKGETLRSMLLNAYGWWKVSQITYIASLAAFALGALTAIGTLFGLTLGKRPEITHEAIPATGESVTTA